MFCINLKKKRTADSKPWILGTKTVYEIDGSFLILVKTCRLSPICGTHLGLTKLKNNLKK